MARFIKKLRVAGQQPEHAKKRDGGDGHDQRPVIARKWTAIERQDDGVHGSPPWCAVFTPLSRNLLILLVLLLDKIGRAQKSADNRAEKASTYDSSSQLCAHVAVGPGLIATFAIFGISPQHHADPAICEFQEEKGARRQYPTPRTVWMSGYTCGPSILRRTRPT